MRERLGSRPVAIGIAVAVVATGSSSAEQLVASRPDHFLDRFSDLVKLVRREAA